MSAALTMWIVCATASCPDADALTTAAREHTSDLTGDVVVRVRSASESEAPASVVVDVEAKSAAGDVVIRTLRLSEPDCASAIALVNAVARRALLALPRAEPERMQPSSPSLPSSSPTSTPASAPAANAIANEVAPRTIVTVVDDEIAPRVRAPSSSSWQLAWAAGGAVGFPLGGDVRGRAALRSIGSFVGEVGVDARVAAPVTLGDGSVWSGTALVVARAAPSTSWFSMGDDVHVSATPFIELGAGALGVAGVGNVVDRAGASPVAHGALGLAIDALGLPLELSIETALPSVSLTLDDGSVASLPVVRLALLVGTAADLADRVDPRPDLGEGNSRDAGN